MKHFHGPKWDGDPDTCNGECMPRYQELPINTKIVVDTLESIGYAAQGDPTSPNTLMIASRIAAAFEAPGTPFSDNLNLLRVTLPVAREAVELRAQVQELSKKS